MTQRTTTGAEPKTEALASLPAEERKAVEWPKPGTARTEETIVGLAEILVSEGPRMFSFIGLGSCVGICALDPVANVGGAVHVMLPNSCAGTVAERLGMFANTGIEEMVRRMVEAGAQRTRIQAAYAGGACIGAIDGGKPTLDIGPRNLSAVKEVLLAMGMSVVGADEGGTSGRTLKMATVSGEVFVRTIQMGEAVICSLRA